MVFTCLSKTEGGSTLDSIFTHCQGIKSLKGPIIDGSGVQ